MNTDTPRTNNNIIGGIDSQQARQGQQLVFANFARELERELNQWRDVAERLNAVLETGYQMGENGLLINRHAADEAREAFNNLKAKP